MYEKKNVGREIFLTEEMFSSLIYLGLGQFIRNSQNFPKKCRENLWKCLVDVISFQVKKQNKETKRK